MTANSFKNKAADIIARWYGDHLDRRPLSEALSDEFAVRLAKRDWTPAEYPRAQVLGPAAHGITS